MEARQELRYALDVLLPNALPSLVFLFIFCRALARRRRSREMEARRQNGCVGGRERKKECRPQMVGSGDD